MLHKLVLHAHTHIQNTFSELARSRQPLTKLFAARTCVCNPGEPRRGAPAARHVRCLIPGGGRRRQEASVRPLSLLSGNRTTGEASWPAPDGTTRSDLRNRASADAPGLGHEPAARRTVSGVSPRRLPAVAPARAVLHRDLLRRRGTVQTIFPYGNTASLLSCPPPPPLEQLQRLPRGSGSTA
eukprot:COSAG02_NODE_24285_length_692_cov_98.509275_1_plen_183_part_00